MNKMNIRKLHLLLTLSLGLLSTIGALTLLEAADVDRPMA
jgi:hypothetical protein